MANNEAAPAAEPYKRTPIDTYSFPSDAVPAEVKEIGALFNDVLESGPRKIFAADELAKFAIDKVDGAGWGYYRVKELEIERDGYTVYHKDTELGQERVKTVQIARDNLQLTFTRGGDPLMNSHYEFLSLAKIIDPSIPMSSYKTNERCERIDGLSFEDNGAIALTRSRAEPTTEDLDNKNAVYDAATQLRIKKLLTVAETFVQAVVEPALY